MPTLTSAERIGSLIAGRYEIKRLLGEGGFSSVYEAVHAVTGRSVAVKVLHPHLVSTAQIRQRFLMESRAMARISHDGIVQVLDAGADDDDTVFMVLELLTGEPLDSTLSRVRLTWDETVNVGLDVLAALSEAHKHKIIHRDIKPGNIFVVHKSDGSSHAKVLDFGIAHVARVDAKPITQQGMILGTPEYMSPEQGRSGAVGPEADIWSVGIVLFECLTGFTPFAAESITEVLLKVATSNAPSLRGLSPEVPAPIAAVIDRSLQRDVHLRYRSADRMREALLEARVMIDGGRVSSESVRPPAPTPTPTPAAQGENPLDAGASVKISSRFSRPESPRTPMGQPLANSPEGARRRQSPTDARFAPDPWTSEDSGSSGGRASRGTEGEFDPLSAQAASASPQTPEPLSGEKSPSGERAEARRSGDNIPAQPARIRGAATPLEGYRAGRTTFNAPPEVQGKVPVLVAAGVLLVGAISWLAFGGASNTTPESLDGSPQTDSGAGVVIDPGVRDVSPAVDVVETPMVSRYVLAPPGGGAAADQVADFARHAAVSQIVGTTQRVLATCVPSAEGATALLYQLTTGTLLASARSQVACSGFDLGVIPDVSGDGTDDVVSVAPGGDEVVVLNSQTMTAWRRLPMPGARGLVTGLSLSGESLALVYSERAGLTGPTSVQALLPTSGRVRWQVLGSGPLGRVGQPVELGLSVGPDASGDGVSDVAVGIGPVVGAPPDGLPERARCVQLFSGADGTALWREPFCQLRGSGSQSVSLGPDVDGDGRGDVAIGTDRPAGQDPPVVIVSGRDARIIRTISGPPGSASVGFGWPVALGGDLRGGRSPSLAVGSIGPVTYVTVFNGITGGVIAQERLGGVGPGSLRLMPFLTSGAEGAAWNILVGDPGAGLRVLGLPLVSP